MRFFLATELQNRLIASPPPGWTARREVQLLESGATCILGYRPAVDLLLESQQTDERLWLELEISRADPVANHSKFASAHLMQPLSERGTFVSLSGIARAALVPRSLSGNALLMTENFDGQWSLDAATVVRRIGKQ